MKRRRNKLSIGGSLGIIVMFMMSFIWPQTQFIAKVGALAIFAFICFAQQAQLKKEGADVQKNILFIIALLAVLVYAFFF